MGTPPPQGQVEEKKIVRLMGYMKNIGGRICLFGEWRQRKQFEDVYGSAKLIVPWDKSLLVFHKSPPLFHIPVVRGSEVPGPLDQSAEPGSPQLRSNAGGCGI